MKLINNFERTTAIVLFAMTLQSNVIAQDEECTLECPIDAPCTFGMVDFNGHPMDNANTNLIGEPNHIDGMYCKCPRGWAGVRCDHPYLSCDSADLICYHGGTCISGLEDEFGRDHLFCDCSTATALDGTRYVGKHCEIPEHNTCDDFDKDNMFCVNGGECSPVYGETGVPCICPEGYEGLHCEFESDVVPPCDLECENDGQCVVGLHSKDESMANVWHKLQDHMTCLCPPGFTGKFCEVQKTQCDDMEGWEAASHHCLNGGTCVATMVNGEEREAHCDCTTAEDDIEGILYAGKHCQYPSTKICADPENPSSDSTEKYFCVNGGQCHPTDYHKGCMCPEGYTGFRCEFMEIEYDDYDDEIVDDFGDNDIDNDNDNDEGKVMEWVTCSNGLICFNGGLCKITELLIDGQQVSEETCDCSFAVDMNTNEHYAGPGCQYKQTKSCSDTDPTLFCVNEGYCKSNPEEGCVCPHGWVGSKCETHSATAIPEPHNSNNNNNNNGDQDNQVVPPPIVECGDKNCYNGGTCTTKQVTLENGDMEMHNHCDCSTAVTKEHIFAGTSCQHKSTSVCTKPSLETNDEDYTLAGQYFCTNHGQCSDNVRADGCICTDGFTGFSCEYEINNLEELNDHHSHHGITNNNGNNNGDDNNNNPNDKNGVTQCGDNLVCHHGSKCIEFEDLGEMKYSCDCSTANTGMEFFAGPSCEHKSNDLCFDAENFIQTYCVNGGTCGFNLLDGCDCPIGFTGDHCEEEVNSEDFNDIIEPDTDTDSITQNSIVPCGGGHCLNGGRCAPVFVTTANGPREEEHCDCSTATDDVGSFFAGEWCEYKSTEICTQSTETTTGNGVGRIGSGRDIFCVNNGICRGNVYQGCDCSTAWTGFHCEYRVSSEDIINNINANNNDDDDDDDNDDSNNNNIDTPPSNNVVSVQCGDDMNCYHGGTCIEYDDLGEKKYGCDCSTAFTKTDLYAGPMCQYKSTRFCSDPDVNADSLFGTLFCVNGGSCKEDRTVDDDVCDCPSGYTGSSCELTLFEGQGDSEDNITPPNTDNDQNNNDNNNGDDPDYIQCGLKCKNDGTCVKGAKDLGLLEDVEFGDDDQLNATFDQERFEHCACPSGFVGLLCEHKVEICGENEHLCLHGSTCVSNDEEHSCDCSTADEATHVDGTDGLFAGASCQHAATDVCSEGEEYPGRPLYFCVNGGTCRALVSTNTEEAQPNPGCDCPEGWTGKHCELSINQQANKVPKDTSNGSTSSRVAIKASVIAVLLVIHLIVLYLIIRRCQRKTGKNSSRSCMNKCQRRRRRRRNMVDDPDGVVNIAPSRSMEYHRSSPTNSDMSPDDEQQPMFALQPDDEPEMMMAPEADMFLPPHQDDDDEDSPIFIGPPKDEDGNDLHNVDII